MYRYVILALALTGCALPPSTFTRPADLYHPGDYHLSYDALYANLFWRCVTPGGGGLRVEGYAVTSMRSSMAILDFEVRLSARDAKGDMLAERWTYGDRINASNIEPIPFAISLPKAGEGARYDLFYQFVVPDGAGQARGGHRGQRVRLVGAGAGFDFFGTIHDVCGGQWRKKAAPSS